MVTILESCTSPNSSSVLVKKENDIRTPILLYTAKKFFDAEISQRFPRAFHPELKNHDTK